jgi:hypothetical protein
VNRTAVSGSGLLNRQRQGLSSYDPMADGADPAELLEFARILTLIAANRLQLQSAQLVQTQSTQNPADLGRRDAGVAAIGLPVQRWRRRRSIFSMTSRGVGWRSRCGRELRSSSPARPSATRARFLTNRSVILITAILLEPVFVGFCLLR